MNDVAPEEIRIEEETPTREPPGRRLRDTREARGVSREEVARALRLNVGLVQALEEDDFDRLPPAAFVTGYLRSYARLLELPSEEIIEGFARLQTPEPPQIVSNIRHGHQVRSSDLSVRLITYFIVIGLAGLLASWWFSQRGSLHTAEKPAAASAQAAARQAPALAGKDGNFEVQPPSAPAGSDVALAQASPAPPEAATPLDAPLEPAAPVEPAKSADPAEPTKSVGTDQPAAPQIAGRAADSVQPVVAADSAKKVAAVKPEPVPTRGQPPAPPSLAPNEPQTKLVLQFSADCWTNIRDAAGRSLIYRLVKGGDRVILHGKAPFRVVLGYAPGVTVQYNGNVFDQTPYRHGDTARFRVGRAEDNAPLNGQE